MSAMLSILCVFGFFGGVLVLQAITDDSFRPFTVMNLRLIVIFAMILIFAAFISFTGLF